MRVWTCRLPPEVPKLSTGRWQSLLSAVHTALTIFPYKMDFRGRGYSIMWWTSFVLVGHWVREQLFSGQTGVTRSQDLATVAFYRKRDSIYSTLIMTKKSPYLKGQMDSHILFCFLKVNIEILQTKRPLTGRPLTTQVSQANDSFPTIVFSTRAAKNLPKRSSNPFLLLRNPKKSCLFPSIL